MGLWVFFHQSVGAGFGDSPVDGQGSTDEVQICPSETAELSSPTAGRCRQRLLTCTRSFREQAHVPAEQSPSREDARLQAAHAHPGRAGRARRAAPQGPCASQRLTSEVSSRSVLAGTPLVGARLVRAPLGVPVLAVTMLSVLARVPLVRVLSRRALGRGAMAREMPRRAVPVAGAQPSR